MLLRVRGHQQLTLSPPMPLRVYALPYWSNPPFLIFDIRALSKIKNGRLDQYGAEPFEQQQFGTAGVEGVNVGHLQLSVPFVCTFRQQRNELSYRRESARRPHQPYSVCCQN